MHSTTNPDNFAEGMGNVANNWNQDRRAMKEGHWTGFTKSVPWEDFIIEESMGPIVDRTNEHLGASDTVIIRARRVLLDWVRDHQSGKPLEILSSAIEWSKIRALSIRWKGRPWQEIDSFSPPEQLPIENMA